MLPQQIADLVITRELVERGSATPDYLREKVAFRDLAQDMADNPKQVLPRLVRLAMEASDGISAGIAILEQQDREFRWFALHGSLAAFEGRRMPLEASPFAITLEQNSPVLMKHPETAYGWLRDAGIEMSELLMVPLQLGQANDAGAVGALWVVAPATPHFSQDHVRVLTELAAFAAVALRMIQAEDRLQLALSEQEQLTQEMVHRVKNLLAITSGMLRLTASSSATKEELVTKLSGRLQALSDATQLVRRSFANRPIPGVGLAQVIGIVMRPYGRTSAKGPETALGDYATNSMALIFHELATNAAKYGALGKEQGEVHVGWSVADDRLSVEWKELGGPVIAKPSQKGFGTSLIESTIARHGGELAYHWPPEGVLVAMGFPIASLVR